MEELDVKFIHYWKKEISVNTLQKLLDKPDTITFKVWCILLDEKLKRNEL